MSQGSGGGGARRRGAIRSFGRQLAASLVALDTDSALVTFDAGDYLGFVHRRFMDAMGSDRLPPSLSTELDLGSILRADGLRLRNVVVLADGGDRQDQVLTMIASARGLRRHIAVKIREEDERFEAEIRESEIAGVEMRADRRAVYLAEAAVYLPDGTNRRARGAFQREGWLEPSPLGTIAARQAHRDDEVRSLELPILICSQLSTGNLNKASLVISQACASGLVAVGIGADLIRSGFFNDIEIMSTHRGDTLQRSLDCLGVTTPSCQPLSQDRSGTRVAEGECLVRLSADRTGSLATIGSTATLWAGGVDVLPDHVTSVMSEVIEPAVPLFCVAHATGTRQGDPAELEAIASLSDVSSPVPVVHTKGGVGHTMHSSGLIGLLWAVACLRRGVAESCSGDGEPLLEAAGATVVGRAPLQLDPHAQAVVNAIGVDGSYSSCQVMSP